MLKEFAKARIEPSIQYLVSHTEATSRLAGKYEWTHGVSYQWPLPYSNKPILNKSMATSTLDGAMEKRLENYRSPAIILRCMHDSLLLSFFVFVVVVVVVLFFVAAPST